MKQSILISYSVDRCFIVFTRAKRTYPMHLEDAFLDKLQWKDHFAFNHIFRLNKFSAEVQVPSSKLFLFFFLDITIKNSVIPFFQETSENM